MTTQHLSQTTQRTVLLNSLSQSLAITRLGCSQLSLLCLQVGKAQQCLSILGIEATSLLQLLPGFVNAVLGEIFTRPL